MLGPVKTLWDFAKFGAGVTAVALGDIRSARSAAPPSPARLGSVPLSLSVVMSWGCWAAGIWLSLACRKGTEPGPSSAFITSNPGVLHQKTFSALTLSRNRVAPSTLAIFITQPSLAFQLATPGIGTRPHASVFGKHLGWSEALHVIGFPVCAALSALSGCAQGHG